MNGNQQLARQRNDKIAIAPTQLKPQEKCLLVELALTAENSKTEISPDLQGEFMRVFANESAVIVQRAFQSWRLRSNFAPSVREIYQLIEEEAMAAYQEREELRQAEQLADSKAARESWKDPKQKAILDAMCAEVGEKLRLSRTAATIANPRARMDNIIALSQSAATLGKIKLPPKKEPHPITDTRAEKVKVAKAAKG